ncbi:MAG: T9SS type A sorting domain-containing protein [Taibaiella sp.]|nr:T9SS type A sorting domain-containing protein [Taibaiella sp.]
MAYGSLAVDGQGNVHRYSTMRAGVKLTPSITTQWGNYDLKYDPNGNLTDVKIMQGIDSNYIISKVEIDKSTNRYYTLFEYSGGTITRSPIVLAAFNADGTQRWKDTTNPRAVVSNFRLKTGDGIYFTGEASIQHGGMQIGGKSINSSTFTIGPIAVIGKINESNGGTQWIHQMGCTNSILSFFDIEVLPDKSLATIGVIGGTVIYNHVYSDTIAIAPGEGHNPLFVNIDSTGLLIDWDQLHGTGFYDNGKVMTSDKVGNVYFGGELINDMQAGSTPKYTSNGGNSDYYIGKFGFDCNCTSMANPTSAFTYTITDSLKKEMQFTFTGTTPHDSVVWRFGDGSVLTQTNPTHMFADSGVYTVCAKVMVPCGRKVICQDIYVPHIDTTTDTTNNIAVINALENVKIYPNPANDVLHIDGLQPGSRIELYDIVGRKAHMIISAKENETVNISYLPSGNYIIQLTDNKGRRMTGKVVKR